jgi:5,10-methylene-tetrahydrofolate dehydrogenase/methenyl tetrahydrofolate cyclohydrolase
VLLKKAGAKLEGANAVVVGRSNIVGMPAALLLVKENATVTICHSKTRDLPGVVRSGDIVIAAIGKAEMIRGDWIKPGAYVIDVGINRKEDPTAKSGSRLVGDVMFSEAVEVAKAITPVPGGVGPMTIALLLQNTYRSAARRAP